MRRLAVLTLLFAGILCDPAKSLAGEDSPGLRLATFSCNVTPPLGSETLRHQPLETVEHPLLAKGVVLEDGRTRYVLCAVDWCLMNHMVQRMVREKIAAAAGTDRSRVAVQCVHQHTAPWADGAVQRLLDQTEEPFIHSDMKFINQAADRMAAAVKESLDRFQPFDRIGAGQAKVDRVASSRRIDVGGGRIVGRGSASGKNPKLAALPEGHIDPMLKTITFAHGDKALARLHYYATHPQSFYGDPRATSDVPGLAREKLQGKEGVFQIYFTGCAGDIAMGKYNDRSRRARDELTSRLLAGMEASIAATRFEPVERIHWRTVPLLLPLRTDPGYTAAENLAKLADPKLSKMARAMAARRVAFAQRSKVPIDVSCLKIGRVYALHLPGEPMVEFQLFAQRVLPKGFVAVAELSDWSPGYICTKQAFSQGGYEPKVSMVTPEGEAVLKAAIRRALGVEQSGRGASIDK